MHEVNQTYHHNLIKNIEKKRGGTKINDEFIT